MRYFLGHFDGAVFHPDDPPETTLWFDYGRDTYAGVTWSDYPQNQRERLFIGWMSNLDYAEVIPAGTFRGAMTLPRRLTLRSFPEGVRLVAEPVAALARLRKEPPLFSLGGETLRENRSLVAGDCLEIVAAFRVEERSAGEFGFRLRKGADTETRVGYNADLKNMFVDRSRAGGFLFKHDAGPHAVPLEPEGGVVKLQVFLDRTSVEVFGNHGQKTITDLIFPSQDAVDTELCISNGNVEIDSLDIYELKSIYNQPQTGDSR